MTFSVLWFGCSCQISSLTLIADVIQLGCGVFHCTTAHQKCHFVYRNNTAKIKSRTYCSSFLTLRITMYVNWMRNAKLFKIKCVVNETDGCIESVCFNDFSSSSSSWSLVPDQRRLNKKYTFKVLAGSSTNWKTTILYHISWSVGMKWIISQIINQYQQQHPLKCELNIIFGRLFWENWISVPIPCECFDDVDGNAIFASIIAYVSSREINSR